MLRVWAQDSTLGWVGLGHKPIDRETGGRQADFWLAETKRVLDADPSAEIARGAAWMLDAPGNGFYFRYLRKPRLSHPQMPPVTLDEEGVAAETLQFTSAAEARCLEVAELATQLAPEDAEAWRSRATLQLDTSGKPRNSHWREVLAESASRDPNNALYDYLKAYRLWEESATVDYSNNGTQVITQVTITDPERFRECLECFERGQQKAYFPATLGDWEVILRFLERTSVPRQEYPALLNSRQLELYTAMLELNLLRMQVNLSAQESPMQQIAHFQKCERLTYQFAGSGDLSGIGRAIILNGSIVANLNELLQKQRATLSATEVKDAEELLVAISRRSLIWEAANNRLPPIATPQSFSSIDLLQQLVANSAAASCVLLGAMAAVCWLVAPSPSSDTEKPPANLGFTAHLLCWLVALVVVGLVLVWGAAHVDDLASQQFFTRTSIISAAAIPLAIAVLAILHRSGWRFSLRQMLVGPAVLGGFMAVIASLGVPLVGDDIDPAVLQAAVPLFGPGTFAWGLLQWSNYSGATVTILLAVLLVGVFAARRCPLRNEPSQWRTWRSTARRVAGEVGRSAAGAGIFALALFLLLAPGALRAIESDYDAKMAWLDGLQDRRSEMAAHIGAIEADGVKMAEIQTLAEQKLSPAQP